MKKRFVAVLAIAAIVAIAAYLVREQSSGTETAGLVLYGNVDIREVQLGFRVGGRLQTMLAEEGDRIEAGTELAALDDKPMRQALAVASAQVQAAQARLDRVTTGSRPQEIQQAQDNVSAAEAALENAESEYRRQAGLIAKNLSSQQALDSTETRRDQASARLSSAREALALAVEGFRREDIAEAQAELATARARQEQANTRLADTRLYSPSAGIIMTRAREPGAMVTMGATVYTLSLSEAVYVRAYVDEPSLVRVQPGTKVQVQTDGNENGFAGQVGFISPRAEFTPKTVETPQLRTELVYRLRIVVKDPEGLLRQGIPVTVRLP